MKSFENRVFSGIQPTGALHLGNYYGAVEQWVKIQNETNYRILYSIVDMHAITLPQDSKAMRKNILEMTACLLACGIDHTRSILFQQSALKYAASFIIQMSGKVIRQEINEPSAFLNQQEQEERERNVTIIPVCAHAELAWILACHSTVAQLSRLPQFKDKSDKLKEIPLGLFIYPILQTADILLYKTTHVPVGEDQLQHLHLAQSTARVFNNKYGHIFPIPQLHKGQIVRVKSLRNSDLKMSKSDVDPKSRIELTDTPDEIRLKFKKALTDFKSEVQYDPLNRPAVSNLIMLHSVVSDKSPDEICRDCRGLRTAEYKLMVADAVINKFNPVRKEMTRLLGDPSYLDHVLRTGAESAAELAEETMQEIKHVVGFQ